MKKITFILTILIVMIIGTSSYAVTKTLNQIVDAFNNCSIVKQYATLGSVWNASCSENKLTITATANNTNINLEYTLEDSILSANFSKEDAITGLVINNALVDSIGQLHGYSDGELFSTLNSEKISDYTLENEGIEIKELSDESYQIQIDIDKKIPLADLSDVYIKVSDLNEYKSYISGDGFAEKTKGNVYFHKRGSNGEYVLLIAEKEELTENTYKSILSIIEVMFDADKATNYFKSNYSSLDDGNKEFTGFKIEVNPTKTEYEESLISSSSGYKFVRININKTLANSIINSNSVNLKEYPNAGFQGQTMINLLTILIAICCASILIISLRKNKEN